MTPSRRPLWDHSSKLRSPGAAQAVGDMETAAVAKLAAENQIPFLAFRAVSDGGGDPLIASALIGFPVQFFIYQQLALPHSARKIAFLSLMREEALACFRAWEAKPDRINY